MWVREKAGLVVAYLALLQVTLGEDDLDDVLNLLGAELAIELLV